MTASNAIETAEVPPASATSNATSDEENAKPQGFWTVRFTVGLLLLDTAFSLLFLSPLVPLMDRYEGNSYVHHYTFGGSFHDLLWVSALRITCAVLALLVSFLRGNPRPETPFDLYHPNGTKKTKEELEEEALEQSFGSWFRRYLHRAAFPCELVALLSTLLCVAKCLVRLNLELGVYRDAQPLHPLFWCVVLVSSVCSVLEMTLCDGVCGRLGEWGRAQLQEQDDTGRGSFLRQISSQLSIPLLANDALQEESNDEEDATTNNPTTTVPPEHAPGISDIGGDTDYKAAWTDLVQLCAPDTLLIVMAFVFLLLAATAQICIPKFTGAILDALDEAYNNNNNNSTTITIMNSDNDNDNNIPIQDIPGFLSNVRKLIVASILGGVFSGIRGSIFTVVGGRVNVRLRLRLMEALLCMEQGFFDVTKTGDITSRLSSDTTLVGDQVTLNVNVSRMLFARSHGWRTIANLTLSISSFIRSSCGRWSKLLGSSFSCLSSPGNYPSWHSSVSPSLPFFQNGTVNLCGV